MLRAAGHAAAILALTAVSQTGGLAWAAALPFRRHAALFALVFLAAYAALWAAARMAAPAFGRVAIPCADPGPGRAAALSPLHCVLNRTYAAPAVALHVDALAQHMEARFPGTRTRTLDAGFPFFHGFPLLPHLSHDDGGKVDLAYFYRDGDGTYQPGKVLSSIGYWGYTEPREGDPEPCGSWTGPSLRWEIGLLRPFLPDRTLDAERTAEMLRWLAANPRGTGYQILIEPHLARRLGIAGGAVGFQGCQAARHDDHLHLQFRR